MSGHDLRHLSLIGVLGLGIVMSVMLGGDRPAYIVRWPDSEAVFAVPGWSTSPENVERTNGYTYVSRSLTGPQGATATLTIVANQNVKVFGAGAEVAFLGDGYTVTPAPPDLMPRQDGLDGLVAERGDVRWLVLYAYGERRGLTGNGVIGWSQALFDSVLGRSNDSYKLFLVTPAAGPGSLTGRTAVELADTLFPRIVGWYAA
jgi:hypothetical protein